MSLHRRNPRRDLNERRIVAALEKAGASPIGVASEYSTTVVSLYDWLRKAGYYPVRHTRWIKL